MATALLVLVVVLVVAALVFGVVTLLSGDDPGLGSADPDGRAVPLPNNRSLTEDDLRTVRFDVGVRGYRMDQVDRVLRRTSYDLGYKDEMIAVLEAEVSALREGRREDANLLRTAREAAANPTPAPAPATARTTGAVDIDLDRPAGTGPDDDLAGTAPNGRAARSTGHPVRGATADDADDEAVTGTDPAGPHGDDAVGPHGDDAVSPGDDDGAYDPGQDTGPGRLARRPLADPLADPLTGPLPETVDGPPRG